MEPAIFDKRKKGVALIAGLVLSLSVTIRAEEYRGIDFPEGAISFADKVISYEPDHSGGKVPTDKKFLDPKEAVGVPDYQSGADEKGAVSLGSGGRITLEFVDNVLTGSDSDAPDLHIYEIGPDVEDTFIEISRNGFVWHKVGKVAGSISSVDIDAFGFTAKNEFRFVRLTDDPDEGNKTGDTVGADIDAVGAISTAPHEAVFPWWILLLAILLLLVSAYFLRCSHRRVIVCLGVAVSTLLLGILLLCHLFLGFNLTLVTVWFVIFFVVSAVVTVCASWTLLLVKRGVLPTGLIGISLVAILLGFVVIVLLFLGFL